MSGLVTSARACVPTQLRNSRGNVRLNAHAPVARTTCVARRGHVVRVAAAAMELPSKYTELTPTGARVFIKCGETRKATSGGVLLPESAAEKATQGRVAAVGQKCEQLKVGDIVMYSKYGLGATSLMFKDEEHLLFMEEDAIGVLPAGGDVPQLQPCGDRVLVKPAKAAAASTGGVLLPESAKEKPMKGEVIAVGPGSAEKKMNLKAGDNIVYFMYAGDKMKAQNGDMYVVLRQQDIFGKMS